MTTWKYENLISLLKLKNIQIFFNTHRDIISYISTQPCNILYLCLSGKYRLERAADGILRETITNK